MRPIFERSPKLRDRVPFEAICELPTPVVEHRGVWVKRDDRIGGGAFRKLEFFNPEGPLLAWGPEGSDWLAALAKHRKARVLTWRPGRGDGLAFGLRMLLEAPRILGGSTTLAPLGGTDPVTTLGFVNAALELADQVARGECPRPDAVFVPLGTCGTAAGLALGFALAGLDVALHAVRILPPLWARARNVHGLVSQAAYLMDERPRMCRLVVEKEFSGLPDPQARVSACLLARRQGVRTPLLWLTQGAMEAVAGAPVP